jgi:hypothetical protein
MIKTEYRILPEETFIADLYLQFKSTERKKKLFGGYKEKEVWRFVPCENVCKVLGYYLSEDSCPTSLPYSSENYFIHDFAGQEWHSITPFAHAHANIEDYFKEMRVKRKKYLDEQEAKKNLKITYLK